MKTCVKNLRMNADVETHALPELWVSEAKLVRIVRTVVQGTVTGRHTSVVAVLVGEDKRGDAVNLGAQVQTILQGRLPVFGLVDTALIGLHEVALWLASHDTH